MALRKHKAESSDIETLRMWLGRGRGNVLKLTHVPSGISVVGEPIGVYDTNGFSRETARLMEELKQKLADNDYDVEAI